MRLWLTLCLPVLFGFSTARESAARDGEVPLTPGRPVFAADKTVEYVPGTLPVVIAAPHGGRLEPRHIPDRTEGVLVTDTDTDLLAREIAEAIHRKTRQHPHLVICHLKRTKVDCNRDALTATGGNAAALETWQAFHDFIERARSTGREFFLDIHGHAHPQPLIELGYQLDRERLSQSGEDFAANEARSSLAGLAGLAESEGSSFEERLRGASSLGGLLEERGFPSVPSPARPHPGDEPYFFGGYNTARYRANAPGERFFSVQVEVPRPGVRDSPRNRRRFAEALAESVILFMERHAEIDLNTWEAADADR